MVGALEGVLVSMLIVLEVLREAYLLQSSLKLVLGLLVVFVGEGELIRVHDYGLLQPRGADEQVRTLTRHLVVVHLDLAQSVCRCISFSPSDHIPWMKIDVLREE